MLSRGSRPAGRRVGARLSTERLRRWLLDSSRLPPSALPSGLPIYASLFLGWISASAADRAVRLLTSGPVAEVTAVSVSAGTRAAIA